MPQVVAKVVLGLLAAGGSHPDLASNKQPLQPGKLLLQATQHQKGRQEVDLLLDSRESDSVAMVTDSGQINARLDQMEARLEAMETKVLNTSLVIITELTNVCFQMLDKIQNLYQTTEALNEKLSVLNENIEQSTMRVLNQLTGKDTTIKPVEVCNGGICPQ